MNELDETNRMDEVEGGIGVEEVKEVDGLG